MIELADYISCILTDSSGPNPKCRFVMNDIIKVPFEKIIPHIDRIELDILIYMDDGSKKNITYIVDKKIRWETCSTTNVGDKIRIYYKKGMKNKAEALFKLYS